MGYEERIFSLGSKDWRLMSFYYRMFDMKRNLMGRSGHRSGGVRQLGGAKLGY